MKKIASKVVKKIGLRGVILVLLLAVLSSALTWFLAQATGLFDQVPPVTVPRVEFVIAPPYLVAIPAGIVTLLLGIVVLVVRNMAGGFIPKKKQRKKRKQQFRSLPDPVQAVLVGLPFVLSVVAGFVLTDFLTAADLSEALALVVAFAVWFAVSMLTYYHLGAADELARWLSQFVAGTVLAAALALGVVAVDSFLLSRTLPGYVPLLVYLLGGPLVIALVIREARRETEGVVSRLLVRTGFAQFQELQTLTVGFALGFVVAVVVAVGATVLGADLAVAALAFVLVWLVVGLVSYQLFRRSSETRSDLVVADVYERSSGRRRELSVRNESDEIIDLRNAKIQDTDNDLYRTNIEVVLGAGQTGTFDLPPEFSLFPRSDDVAGDLPGGFSVSQHTDAPVVVTRDGQRFELEWGESVTPGQSADGHAAGNGPSNEVDDRTGVGPRD